MHLGPDDPRLIAARISETRPIAQSDPAGVDRHRNVDILVGIDPDNRCPRVGLYQRFCLSFRDTEDLLAQGGVVVTDESIWRGYRTFGPQYVRVPRKRRARNP